MKIPVSVVHLKGAKLDGKGPLYLDGYGSYGISNDMFFNSNIFSLVDRGVSGGRGAHSRRRRNGQGLARCRQDDEQEEHFHRFHRSAEDLVKRRDTDRKTGW